MAIENIHDAERVLKFVDSEPTPVWGDAPDDGRLSTHTSIEVRPYHLRDSGMLSAFARRYELRFPESAYEQPGPVRLAMRRLFHAEITDQPLYVALDRSTKFRLGALQCTQQPADDRWHLQFVSLAASEADLRAVLIALLEYAIVAAGQRGARRLLARVEVESSLLGPMCAVGFSAYSREQVFLLNAHRIVETSANVRAQLKADVWSVHQLYLQTTPRDVQNAEALTSHAWDVDSEGRSQRGWFCTCDAGLGAYVRVHTSRHYHVLDVLVAPDMRELLRCTLAGVLAALAEETARPIYLLLRAYQLDLMNDLADVIGEQLADQNLMVKYTTATTPGSLKRAETFELLRPAESDPQRVPSFSVRGQHEHC